MWLAFLTIIVAAAALEGISNLKRIARSLAEIERIAKLHSKVERLEYHSDAMDEHERAKYR